jgi:hypothetical protein
MRSVERSLISAGQGDSSGWSVAQGHAAFSDPPRFIAPIVDHTPLQDLGEPADDRQLIAEIVAALVVDGQRGDQHRHESHARNAGLAKVMGEVDQPAVPSPVTNAKR